MTLITHLFNNGFQFIALDGRVKNSQVTHDHVRKHIKYENGVVFFLNEMQNAALTWIYDVINNNVLKEESRVTDHEQLIWNINNQVFNVHAFNATAIGVCTFIDNQHQFDLIGRNQRRTFNAPGLFASRTELLPQLQATGILALNEDYNNLMATIHRFYADAINDARYNNDRDFNNSLNIVAIKSDGTTETFLLPNRKVRLP
ncbi:MAG: hypothetical protein ACLQQ4_15240 [Bacteroidia bacterium]